MQSPYKTSTLIRGSLIAPLPLLFCLFVYIYISDYALAKNYEDRSHFDFLVTIIVASYLIFIFIISPIIFIVIYLLNKKRKLHLISISIMADGSAILINVLTDYLKNNHLPYTPSEMMELFSLNPFLIPTISSAFVFWYF